MTDTPDVLTCPICGNEVQKEEDSLFWCPECDERFTPDEEARRLAMLGEPCTDGGTY